MSAPAIEGRLHPLAAVMYGLRVARNAAPLLLAGWVTDVPRLVLAGLAAVVLLVGAPVGVLAWWRFRYRIADGRLEVDAGILVRRSWVIPLERIRGVSLDEPLLHRAFGLVRARVDAAAAGESGGELPLVAVSRAQAEALRDAVMRVGERRVGDAPPVPHPPPLAAELPVPASPGSLLGRGPPGPRRRHADSPRPRRGPGAGAHGRVAAVGPARRLMPPGAPRRGARPARERRGHHRVQPGARIGDQAQARARGVSALVSIRRRLLDIACVFRERLAECAHESSLIRPAI